MTSLPETVRVKPSKAPTSSYKGYRLTVLVLTRINQVTVNYIEPG